MTFAKNIVLTFTLLTSAELILGGYQNNSTLARTLDSERKVIKINSISEYDMVFQTLADSTEWDWKLLAAIAYTESRFTPDIKSPRGATGLMQIMPRTAIQQGFEVDSLTDPKTNILAAIKVLDVTAKSFRFPKTMNEREKLSVILAAYNGGIGTIIEARRAANADGASFNNWSTLSNYITRNGTHYETVAYVSKVLRTYDKYKAS